MTPSVHAAGTVPILVVDDDEGMRHSLERLLQSRGYQVVTASDGEAAVALLRDQHAEFALVLLDLMMPGLDGVETYRMLRQLRPEVKIVLMSGHSEADATGDLDDGGLTGFLQKPIERKVLFQLVSDVVRPS